MGARMSRILFSYFRMPEQGLQFLLYSASYHKSINDASRGMISRYYWLTGQQREAGPEVAPSRISRKQWLSWLLLVALSLAVSTWLIYRWLIRPSWLAALPAVVDEALTLSDMAAALTLVIVWTGLALRYRRRSRQELKVLSLEQLYGLSPADFERYVAELFRHRGYLVIWRGRSGDHGVDLELNGPRGRRAVVQCKRYQNTVGEEIVRDLYGTLLHEGADRAFLVTTAPISDAAHEWADGKPITLIDGQTLVLITRAMQYNPPGKYANALERADARNDH